MKEMIKKNIILSLIISFVLLTNISAECNLNVSLINQDPYPAIPGETIKVVFQIDGISDSSCGEVNFEVKESYPFTIDAESKNPLKINSGIYAKNYNSFYIAPYKLRVDKDAMNEDSPIEVVYSNKGSSVISKDFNIKVEDTRADFEISIKDYNYKTKILTLEILNIEKVNIQALTVEIPKQENIKINGANRVIVGDLDSNEYTTAEFTSTIKQGESKIILKYTDSAGYRREINKTIFFDSEYFIESSKNNSNNSPIIYIVVIAVILGIFLIVRNKKKNSSKN